MDWIAITVLTGIALSGFIIGFPLGMLIGKKKATNEFIRDWEDDWEEEVPGPVKRAFKRLGEDQILEAKVIK